ncbi:MAG TPA: SDR family oxidoreductase [Vicinamibacterales bacterium]|nr:SDR family oxidoreductase [Vicinamibacterales bacterium]
MADLARIAIVTGASRGLGTVVARVLAGRGWDLVIGGRDARALTDVETALARAGRRVRTVVGDVTEAATRRRLVAEASALGGLQLLVNNASELGVIAPLAEVDLERFERVLRANVVAPLGLVQLALPLLVRAGGLVVNVTSDAAVGAYPGWGGYGASKAALELLTRTLASEIGEQVTVVSVDPGDMRTRMHQEAYPGQDVSDRPLPEVTEPFWRWLFDQDLRSIGGRRFAAQQESSTWLQPA